MPWNVQILTLFPEMFPGVLGHSIAGRALKDKIWSLELINIRKGSKNKHGKVDAKPAGGGAGMIIRADVLHNALEISKKGLKNSKSGKRPIIYLTPQGAKLTQKKLHQLSLTKGIILICGRYEGIDQRFLEQEKVEQISIGDYILPGGEAAAMVLVDGIVRLLPGVVKNRFFSENESFVDDLLEYPQYTRPLNWKGKKIPKVLLSGNHRKINAWRRNKSEEVTKMVRPDLWKKYIKK